MTSPAGPLVAGDRDVDRSRWLRRNVGRFYQRRRVHRMARRSRTSLRRRHPTLRRWLHRSSVSDDLGRIEHRRWRHSATSGARRGNHRTGHRRFVLNPQSPDGRPPLGSSDGCPAAAGICSVDSESTAAASGRPAGRGDGKTDVYGLIASRHARDNRRRATHHR